MHPISSLQTELGATYSPSTTQWIRRLLGLILIAVPLRILTYGWLDALYLEPRFRFVWVTGLPSPTRPLLLGLFALFIGCGAAITAGWRTRTAAALYLVGFAYLEALDKTLYLNHYVLLSLLLLLFTVAPANRVPGWWIWLLRAVLASVYVHAGLCKLNPDWLLRGEPLHTWFLARQDLPVVGPLLAERSTALAMSWGGAAYDLLIAALLLHPRTRSLGFALVGFFHAVTAWLFPIGVFPWVMLVGSLAFLPDAQRQPGIPLSSMKTLVFCAIVLALVGIPLRHHLVDGNVNWHEQGYRFAWRVLLNEKTGWVDFTLVLPDGTRRTLRASQELTPIQHEQMRTQPDLIRDYAHHLARKHGAIEVYADSWASLNGRPPQRMVRAEVDLLSLSWWARPHDWIEPLATPQARARPSRAGRPATGSSPPR